MIRREGTGYVRMGQVGFFRGSLRSGKGDTANEWSCMNEVCKP